MNIRSLLLAMVISLTLPAIAYSQAETPLLPEVKKILEVPVINKADMDQNAYVYLLAMMIDDENREEIVKQFLIQNNQWLRQAVGQLGQQMQQPRPELKVQYKSFKNEINGQPYISPCRLPSKKHCVDDILAQREALSSLIKENKELLARYEKIISLPFFDAYFREVRDDFTSARIISFSQFRQFQAIEAIVQGRVNEGLEILQQEINFSKKLILSKGLFLDKFLGEVNLFRIYHTVSDLLDRPELASSLDNPNLEALLASFPDDNAFHFDTALEYDRTDDLYELLLGIDGIKKLNYGYVVNRLEGLDKLAKEEKITLTFDLNKTLNKLYQKPNISLEQLKQPNTATYLELKEHNKTLCNKKSATFKEQFLKTYDKANVIGDYLLCGYDNSKSVANNIYRLYDLKNYLALVKLKLLIKQKNLKAEQIPQFLSEVGDQAINPYTQQPFVWSKEQQTLSADRLTVKAGFYNFDETDKLSIQIIDFD